MRALIGLAPLALLAACGDGEGTAIAVNVDDPAGAVNASAGKDGTVAIKAPGFSGSFKLPKIQLDAGSFDINGVHLPAESKITNINVAGSPGADKVRVEFSSPIAPAAVIEHFRAGLEAKGFKLAADGLKLRGTTDDGKPFALETKAGVGGAQSVLTIS